MPNFQLPDITEDMSQEELLAVVGKMKKTLDWILYHLDTTNVDQLNANVINTGILNTDLVQIRAIDGGMLLNKNGVIVDRGHYFLAENLFTVNEETGEFEINPNAKLQIVGEGQNMIFDHSFEMLPVGQTDYGNQTFNIDLNYLQQMAGWWIAQGNPRVRNVYQTDALPFSLFDYKSAIVDDTNYLYTEVFVLSSKPTGPYTVSIYGSPHELNTTGNSVGLTIQVRCLDYNYNQLQVFSVTETLTESYTLTDTGTYKRVYLQMPELPSGTEILEISFKGSGGWVEIDGAQCVPYNYPTVYNAESALWAHMNSKPGMEHRNLSVVGYLAMYDPSLGYFTVLKPNGAQDEKFAIMTNKGLSITDASGTVISAAFRSDYPKAYLPWIQLQPYTEIAFNQIIPAGEEIQKGSIRLLDDNGTLKLQKYDTDPETGQLAWLDIGSHQYTDKEIQENTVINLDVNKLKFLPAYSADPTTWPGEIYVYKNDSIVGRLVLIQDDAAPFTSAQENRIATIAYLQAEEAMRDHGLIT